MSKSDINGRPGWSLRVPPDPPELFLVLQVPQDELLNKRIAKERRITHRVAAGSAKDGSPKTSLIATSPGILGLTEEPSAIFGVVEDLFNVLRAGGGQGNQNRHPRKMRGTLAAKLMPPE